MPIADVSSKSIAELMTLNGRCAVVTGGAQGLGKAIANRLAEAGAAVLIGDLKEDAARNAAAELARRHNTKAISIPMDVSSSQSVAAAAEFAVMQLGRIDIWVNNAGIFPSVPLVKMGEDVWNQVMDVNLRGVFLGAQAAARQMIASKVGGVIINVVSTAGFGGVAPGLAAYVASKHGVRGVTKQMALELACHDIRVLGVAPTFCVTEGNMAAMAANPNKNVATEIPSTMSTILGRVGVADDIGRVVLFCASDMSAFMTGSTLLVDAGETI